MWFKKQTRISFSWFIAPASSLCSCFSVGFSITFSLIDYISGMAEGHSRILPNDTQLGVLVTLPKIFLATWSLRKITS